MRRNLTHIPSFYITCLNKDTVKFNQTPSMMLVESKYYRALNVNHIFLIRKVEPIVSMEEQSVLSEERTSNLKHKDLFFALNFRMSCFSSTKKEIFRFPRINLIKLKIFYSISAV